MAEFLQRVRQFRLGSNSVPLFFFALTIAAYSWMLPWLGYYWDEWPFAWIYDRLGPEGLMRYFSTNRPIWGLFYQVDMAILGTRQPLLWHLYALLWRWGTGLAAWRLVKTIWPLREEAALLVGLLFLVYPGFGQQSLALLYSHFFIVITLFLTSLILLLQSIRTQSTYATRAKWLYAASLGLGLVNLLSMEYFFTLDLVRWLMVWIVLGEQGLSPRERVIKTVKICLPFLGLMVGVAVWRTFFFGFHTYTPVFLDGQPEVNPEVEQSQGFLASVLSDTWIGGIDAWLRAYQLPYFEGLGLRTSLIWGMAILLAAVATGVYLSRISFPDDTRSLRRWAFYAVLMGLVSLLVAGMPYWIAKLPVLLNFPNNRFTLSYLLGSSLTIAGLLALIPGPRGIRITLISILVGGAVGAHMLNGVEFRRDWNLQKNFFWQLSWRVPDLRMGTTVFSNELPIRYCTDNSLTAPLNWMYAPDEGGQEMRFLYYYPTVRLGGGLPSLEKGLPIRQDYLAARFEGSTSQMVGIYYRPPACLRIVDPEVDSGNWMLPAHLRDALHLSTTGPILANSGISRQPPAGLLGEEPAQKWCYYFEKADLARQQRDWNEVVRLSELAFQTGDYPNDPAERFPFIEGYAHTGRWNQALEQTHQAYAVTNMLGPVLCRLWERIERNTPVSTERDAALKQVISELACVR